MGTLPELLVLIATGDRAEVERRLSSVPDLATATLARNEEFLLTDRLAQVYEGDTALHAAAFSYDMDTAAVLLGLGADVRARNRRGAEPLHAAVMGGPGIPGWDPSAQRAMIRFLVEAGADPDATAAGGVTALHRAVRNRCSAAVDELLQAGADPLLRNDGGSTASDLTRATTGRGGTGTPAAKAERQCIRELLEQAAKRR